MGIHKEEADTAGVYDDKLERIRQALHMISSFKDFLNEESWAKKFDAPFHTYLNQTADPNLKVFMGFEEPD